MSTRKAKRERESEQTGRARGLIGPFKYRGKDAWLCLWEARDERDREYARDLVRAHRGVPTDEWPEEAIVALIWLVRAMPDPLAN